MATATEEARRQVIAAREALGGDLDEFTSATRTAVDIPAKIRKSPVKTAGIITGAGFLVAGGPRRVLSAVGSRVRPGSKRAKDDEANKADRDRAARRDPRDRNFFVRHERILGVVGALAAKQLADRLFSDDDDEPADGEPGQGSATTEGHAGTMGRGAAAGTNRSGSAGSSRAAGLAGLGDRIRRRTSRGG